jgi:type II secretory pathway pseudopilin PulG
MRKFAIRKSKKNRQAGLTMIEVLIAAAVVIVGFMATLGLVLTAIASNNRNRMDSTGTMIAQAVVENISSVLVGSGTDSLTDCAGNNWTIDTGVGGATMSGSQIDFTQASPPANYHMNYAVCNATSQTTYDVRWNVQTVTANTYLITVGVKMRGSGTGGNKFFAFPVTLRTYVSN